MKYLLKFEHHTSKEPIEVICKSFDDICTLSIVVNASPYTENLSMYSFTKKSEMNCINEYFTILEKTTPFDYYN